MRMQMHMPHAHAHVTCMFTWPAHACSHSHSHSLALALALSRQTSLEDPFDGSSSDDIKLALFAFEPKARRAAGTGGEEASERQRTRRLSFLPSSLSHELVDVTKFRSANF